MSRDVPSATPLDPPSPWFRVRDLATPPAYIDSRVFEFRGRRILIVRFTPLRRRFRGSFGIHLKRLQDVVYLARALDASLYIVWYRGAPNQAVNLLASPDLRIIRPSRVRDLLVAALWVATDPIVLLTRLLRPRAQRLDRLADELAKARKRSRLDPPGAARLRIARLRERRVRLTARALAWTPAVPIYANKNLRREMAGNPIRMELRPAEDRAARALAARLGIEAGAPIVTMHIRERGWRPIENDPRSCDPDTYRPAVDELVSRGLRVVRIGDASMTPIDWPGVIDLATWPERTDLLELWCMLSSVFFLGSESGPLELAKLIGVPMLIANVKTVQSGFPLHPPDLFILKRIHSPTEPRILSLREQLSIKAGQAELGGPVRYHDNSAAEILEGVIEFLDDRHARDPESPAQSEFRRLAGAKTIKGRDEERYLGEGRLARFFADRFLDYSEPLGPEPAGVEGRERGSSESAA